MLEYPFSYKLPLPKIVDDNYHILPLKTHLGTQKKMIIPSNKLRHQVYYKPLANVKEYGRSAKSARSRMSESTS